jgi:hypothetical protein
VQVLEHDDARRAGGDHFDEQEPGGEDALAVGGPLALNAERRQDEPGKAAGIVLTIAAGGEGGADARPVGIGAE